MRTLGCPCGYESVINCSSRGRTSLSLAHTPLCAELLVVFATAKHVSEAAGLLLGQQGAASPLPLDPAGCAWLEMACLFSLLCSHAQKSCTNIF